RIPFGVDAAMLCIPRRRGRPAFVIAYICRENRIRSVTRGAPPPSRRQRSSNADRLTATDWMSIGVMPRVNRCVASASADSASSVPATASPRAVLPWQRNEAIVASARQARGVSTRLRGLFVAQRVLEQARAALGLVEPRQRAHDLVDGG